MLVHHAEQANLPFTREQEKEKERARIRANSFLIQDQEKDGAKVVPSDRGPRHHHMPHQVIGLAPTKAARTPGRLSLLRTSFAQRATHQILEQLTSKL